MKLRLFLGVMVIAVAIATPSTVQAQFFSDGFDTYAAGSGIIGQGNWEGWDNDPQWDATVSDLESYSPPNSLFAAVPMDIVQVFSGVDSGVWYAKFRVFIPSTMTGDLYFIILDTYAHGSPDKHWAVQMVMCVTGCGDNGLPGFIHNYGGSDFPGGETAPLVIDDWAEIVVEVDLDASIYNAWYDGTQFVIDAIWQSTGLNEIQAFDLFSESNLEGYYDDVWLDQTIPVELMSFDIE